MGKPANPNKTIKLTLEYAPMRDILLARALFCCARLPCRARVEKKQG